MPYDILSDVQNFDGTVPIPTMAGSPVYKTLDSVTVTPKWWQAFTKYWGFMVGLVVAVALLACGKCK